MVPLDSLSSGEPFVGELSLLREIDLPPSGFIGPAFIPGTAELIYRYGLTLRRFDLTSDRYLGEVNPHVDSNLGTFRIAPSGDYAVIADGSDLVVVDLSTGEVDRRVEVAGANISGIVFPPSGKLLVTQDFAGELVVWSPATWEVLSRFQHPSTDPNRRLSSDPRFLPSEEWIALEAEPGHVYLLDLDGNMVGEIYIGARGELPLVGEPGGSLVLGQELDFTVFDPAGAALGGIRLITRDCRDHETPVNQLVVLDSEGRQIGCHYLLDTGSYRLPDDQGGLLGTVEIRARRISFRTSEGDLVGEVRVGFFEYGGTLVEVLDNDDESVDRAYLDYGRYLTLLPGGRAVGTFTGRAFLCVELKTSDASCSMPFEALGVVFSGGNTSFPEGYWLALDADLRLRLFDFVQGREAFVSQPLELSVVRGLALSDDRAFIALIVNKADTPNSFLQIWGYPAH